jgi:hypothetical protein
MQSQTVARLALVAVALAAAVAVGCADLVDLPEPAGPELLIEAVLVAGANEGNFRVVRVFPGEGAGPNTPVPETAVSLRLAGPDGSVTELVPAPGLGRFRAAMPIAAGARYLLRGSIEGRAISAETVVPQQLRLTEPAGDTVTLALGQLHRLAIRWHSPGASVLTVTDALFQVLPPGTGVAAETRDTVGELIVAPPTGATDLVLEFWAMNPDVERYLYDRSSPRGNLQGGFGLLGGAATARRVLRWR